MRLKNVATDIVIVPIQVTDRIYDSVKSVDFIFLD